MEQEMMTGKNPLQKITDSKLYVDIMSFLFQIFVVLTFFFPAYYSDFKKNSYFIGFLWPYAVLVVFLAMVFLKNWNRKWQEKGFAICYLQTVVVYMALSLYMNQRYHHWMWEEIHNLVAFGFVIMLVIYPGFLDKLNLDIIKFLIRCIVLSIFCSIVLYFMGYVSFEICNNQIEFQPLLARYGENRMSWIYYHKSQFGMMQLVFIGFCYRYRGRFRNVCSQVVAYGIFTVALVLSHSWTSLLAAFLILGGIFLDYMKKKKIHLEKKHYAMLAGPAVLVVISLVFMLKKLIEERNLLTLGTRIPIWKSGIAYILSHPTGVGKEFGTNLLNPLPGFWTNNCHNLFLNAMFRFSIPVGILFIVLFFAFILYLLGKNKSFFNLGYLLAILAVLMIDYALLSYGLASFFLLVYLTLRKDEMRV